MIIRYRTVYRPPQPEPPANVTTQLAQVDEAEAKIRSIMAKPGRIPMTGAERARAYRQRKKLAGTKNTA